MGHMRRLQAKTCHVLTKNASRNTLHFNSHCPRCSVMIGKNCCPYFLVSPEPNDIHPAGTDLGVLEQEISECEQKLNQV